MGSPRLWWGAKARYYNYSFHLPTKKMQVVGGSISEQQAISQWVDAVGLPELRKLVEVEKLGDAEERVIIHRDIKARFIIFANPKESYGYLYICAIPYDPN